MQLLGARGEAAHGATRDLVVALRDPVREVRQAAALALGWMRARSPHAVEGLVCALQDRYSWVRSAAAISLGEIAIQHERSIKALSRALADKDPFVRGHAVDALSWLLKKRAFVLPVVSMLRHGDWRARQSP